MIMTTYIISICAFFVLGAISAIYVLKRLLMDWVWDIAWMEGYQQARKDNMPSAALNKMRVPYQLVSKIVADVDHDITVKHWEYPLKGGGMCVAQLFEVMDSRDNTQIMCIDFSQE